MGSASSSTGSSALDTASQSSIDTPPALSMYTRRYHAPASLTYSTSQTSQPAASTIGFARANTVSVTLLMSSLPYSDKQFYSNKKSGRNPLSDTTT